ncbi:50S ribosomal protein L24 [Methylophilaceae bacterium]|nr:50S ribosomal protein L24 [Nitrosomonadales bacterium]MCH9771871.1 50S ribosomal protein L24 [Betaproteobacteria bacterium]MDA9086307.1 50S ribosomal protein L24 [Methylophilaceae bacterium]MBT6232294.1 50S ribosomal protein L24 [Nitrosomonadales bacterium]MBT6356304.1 50S ribosomal protein L24 [Nitrosomonadales bacterium]
MNKIRKGDKVILNSGKDKGKQGIVLSILKNNRVVVEGLNMVKKHTKPNPAKGDQGGLVSKEMPINISNIAIYNTKSNKTDKVNFKNLKDGKKIRIYKSTQEAIDV